jgi:hypothetical protein
MGEEIFSVFGNKMLRRISGCIRGKVEEYYIMRSFVLCTFI